ncbi:Endocytosis and vacuole integrity protein [Neocucurbitaria cava]|uniref:Endocytosis and vacuole integrity protein n=1 Tax=Neocucurbitaria cava TaxID=798079 RepID=A0A9W9CKN1_9PLEO|nr:Endocytosis and vacuole integrity protein [Neocucurbitaria cava]
MTAQILAAELGNLIQDSKRKNSELRNAAEQALQDLKSLANTSEAQLSADISRRPHFISPFLVACGTHNAKLASTGVSCLQRLSVSRALPKERLTEVLEALKESVTSSHDIQLKILQALPSLLQNYATETRGETLSIVLQICSGLQNAKNFAVSNTAAATLQQLVITVFDRVASEDERALEIPTATTVKGDDGPIPVRPAANDAYKLLNDLVLLVMGEKPTYMRFTSLPPSATLELIEAILSNHDQIMTTHPEQIYILRTLLMPLIIRSLSDRLSFPVTVRVIRILNLVIRNHLEILPSECEIALGLLNHMLDPEASQLWKRALCLEVFRGIYADSRLLLAIYTNFDAVEGKKSIFGDNLAAFVRLAVEKPSLIGLGQQSTVPTTLEDGNGGDSTQVVAEAGALAGVIGGPVADSSSNAKPFGVSTQWSTLKTPCIEHLDKLDPPMLPDTYVYSLVLTCITNISESLAKFVLPLTVHHESKSRKKGKTEDTAEPDIESASPQGANTRRLSRTLSFRKKTIPVNPLDLTEHSAYGYIRTSSTLVSECWPAVLATCSTFLNAALDTNFYRALVRSIQKFTQVAGLLRLATPRDAFLTTLSKAAVPSNLLLAGMSSPKSASAEKSGMFSNPKGLLSVDSLVSQASSMSGEQNRRPSHEVRVPALSARNLLCLRALLNLAIALGPTLQSAWSIIFETLQVADLVMAFSSHSNSRMLGASGHRAEPENSADKVEAETSAVQAAARRLFESTVDFPNESFSEVLQALCSLLDTPSPSQSGQRTPTTSGRPQILHQRRLGSVSGISLNTETNSRDSAFALNKIGELAALNEVRLSQYEPAESGWDIFITEVVRFCADDRNTTSTRLLAADILSRTIREIAAFSMSDDQREGIQARILSALQTQISSLHRDPANENNFTDTSIRVQQIALEALKGVIEQCGDSLVAGWGSVLDSLMSVFVLEELPESIDHKEQHAGESLGHREPYTVEVISRSLARTAFATVNLICSDFLSAVPEACLSTLIDLLHRFCCQQEDLNMSLTAITFFWNVSDFLQSRSDLLVLPQLLGNIRRQEEVRHTVASRAREGLIPALWLQVLLDLSSITTDERTEVRNSAIQTIQRIFENYAEQLSSDVWLLCLRIVLFGMVEANLNVQRSIRKSPTIGYDVKEWNDTTNTILQTVGVLTTTYMDKLDAAQFSDAWIELLGYLQQYFDCVSHALAASVFITISGVLSHLDKAHTLNTPPLVKTAAVWKSYFNSRDAWQDKQEGNQDAFVAYADAFKAIYQLSSDSITTDLPAMLANLEAAVIISDVVAYSSDVDNMTTLQSRVMECLSMVKTDTAELPSYLIQLLSRLTLLPYTSLVDDPEKRGPTFVALSKAAMTLLRDVMIRHIHQEEIYTSGAFLFALSSLAKPMKEKYKWEREGKPPALWQKATTTAIAVLRPGLSQINTHVVTAAAAKDIWTVLVDITHFITRAQLSSTDNYPPNLEQDQTFDIESFISVRSLITTSLGSNTLPDTLRRTYTRNLFSTSLLHTPLPGEVPDLTSAPLEELYRIRLGQTAELEPTLRTEMSYACLSELFNLVSTHDGSPERIKLARAAAPYLILRAALPLKTYVADHRLRGCMPAPASQRRELLLVLSELGKLKSEPEAIPDAPGVSSEHRKHLHRLYPLLIKASRVAKQDPKVLEQLVKLLDLVGDEFGLEDD